MVKGKTVQRTLLEKPTVNYRKLDALNQSMLKKFDENPLEFFDEFKMGKKKIQKKNMALIIGDLVDFYVLQCKGDEECFNNRMDERFSMIKGKIGSGQVFKLADYLFDETIAATNPEGEVTTSFEDRFTEALRKIQDDGLYKKKTFDYALQDFEKNAKDYFETKIANVDKVVVDQFLVDKSIGVGNMLMTDDFTKDFFQEGENMEFITHYPIEWIYTLINGKTVACKSEVDGMIIDHDSHIIQPFDLKTSFDNEGFDYMYIKNSYYLQNAFYHSAVNFWKDENNLSNYLVMPLKFIVGDTSMNNRRPLVYITSTEDIHNGLYGFNIRGTHHRGVHELIEAIAWAEDTGNWSVSKEAFENNGQMKLNVQYD